MLEKPEIEDVRIIGCMQEAFGLTVGELVFLPLGADRNTAVYRAVDETGVAYFVKLRSGIFDDLSVEIPRLLHEQGIRQVIPPIATRDGHLWARLERFHVMVSPFVEGRNGWEVALTDAQWVEFGRALKGLHSAVLPASLVNHLKREDWSPEWREKVRGFQALAEESTFTDPVSVKLAAFLRTQRDTINNLVERAERLAAVLKAQTPPLIMCHADIHVGNLLLEADGTLHIVDWDTLILAPKERDLMFVGGGLGGAGHTPEEEERLFYEGYGQTVMDKVTLAYYRYERVVQDISAFCEDIFLTEGGADREQGLKYLMGSFQRGEVVEIAFRSDYRLPPE